LETDEERFAFALESGASGRVTFNGGIRTAFNAARAAARMGAIRRTA
jgi:hypothetical protein